MPLSGPSSRRSRFKAERERLQAALGLTADISLANRSFVLVALTMIFLTGMGILTNLSLQLPLIINAASLGCCGSAAYLLYDWRRRPEREPKALALTLISLLTLGVIWFPNGGFRSALILFIPAVLVLSGLMLTASRLYLVMALTVAEMALLGVLEALHPEWLFIYTDPLQALLDYVSTVLLLSLPLGYCVHALVKAYNRERLTAYLATEAKTRFISQMSHELRTPLNSVIGFSGHLLNRGERVEGKKRDLYLERIRANGEHLLALVNQLLDISRIEAAGLELYWQEIDSSRLLHEVADLIEVLAQEKGLQLSLDLPENPPALWTDPQRLRQILLNLLSNAVKYTPAGRIAFRLRQGGGQIRIEVEDSGPGIPADQREAIFEPFYRLPGHESIQGAGMGLPITRLLCRHLGYDLQVLEAPIRGSLFVLSLPLQPPRPEPRPG